MLRSLLPTSLAALAALPSSAAAQDPCEGNHLGPVYMETSPAYLGGTFEIDLGSPAAPLGLGLLSISDGYGPVFHPLVGTACLDMFSPFYQVLLVPLDAAGNFHLSVGLPPDAALLGAPPIYAAPSAVVGGQIWNGKTLPLYFTFPDAWTPTADLPAQLSFHRATSLGDGPQDNRIKVFVSGGSSGTLVAPIATDATLLYEPLDRTFLPGPTMSVPRVYHTQTKLDDGRLLILGGCNTGGVVHASGEIYDHDAGTLTPIAPMSTPRSGHAATLLSDGRVLVTGGLLDYQIALSSLDAALDTAQDTAEIYDPATDTWTPTANTMSSRRGGHDQVVWHDGRVLVVSGINQGITDGGSGLETAVLTPNCDWFDPATDTFSPAPPISNGAAFFGHSFLDDGRLLVTGGMRTQLFGGAPASASVDVFDGTAWGFLGTIPPLSLPVAVAFHTQETLPDGRVLILGGLTSDFTSMTGTDTALLFDGTAFQSAAPIGTSSGSPAVSTPRGAHTMTRMWDGTYLVLGGTNGSFLLPTDQWVRDDGSVYAP
jgi:hypothetical protein